MQILLKSSSALSAHITCEVCVTFSKTPYWGDYCEGKSVSASKDQKAIQPDGAASILNPNLVVQMWLCRGALHSDSKSLRRYPESVWVGT